MAENKQIEPVLVKADDGTVTHVRILGAEIPVSYASLQGRPGGGLNLMMVVEDVKPTDEGGPTAL